MVFKMDTKFMQSHEEVAIAVNQLSKEFNLFYSPGDRFKSLLVSSWGRREKFTALNSVSFSINRGEIVGVIGANGAGKSTLLQMLCGTLAPTSGSLAINGRISALLELGAGFNFEYTGIENVKFYCALNGISGLVLENVLPKILEFADIGEHVYQPVKTYSSGMYVRLAFAAAIHIDPDILIVDEALSVGDVSFQAKCLERMERLMKQGTTVLLVTHDVQMVKQYCDRVLYIKQGALVYDGPSEEGTEIYLNESREKSLHDHKLERASTDTVGAKLSFGSEFGAITAAKLISGQNSGRSILVSQGARVELEVTARIADVVQHPRLQMTIRDRRGFNLFGFNERYAMKKIMRDAVGNIKLRFGFDAALQMGDYAITLRLDDSSSPHDVKMLDKQVGIADFTIVAAEKRFDAVVDLNGSCEVLL
jgi:lipopolysaccharide transport system ATP-binding protein